MSKELEKKAMASCGRIICEQCPLWGRCNMLTCRACSWIYKTAYMRGYNARKREEFKQKKELKQ